MQRLLPRCGPERKSSRFDSSEHRVFSLLDELSNYLDLLQYVADHTRTLGNLYNLRLVYSKTTKLTNPYFGRAIFNRNAIIANNAIAMQTKDVDAVGSRCSVCNTTLPVGNDFSVVVHCNFPLCLHPAMLRPVPPIVGLHTSGVPAAFQRQVMLTNRNALGASMTRCKMLFRYRQGGIGKERPESWTVGRTAYTAAYARNLVWPVALSPWKLVQFSVAIRVNRCTCGYDEETGTQTTVYECYKNHLRGVASCAATWTPWSKPSIRVFPPSKYEASFINRRAALLIRHTAENVAEYDSQSEEF